MGAQGVLGRGKRRLKMNHCGVLLTFPFFSFLFEKISTLNQEREREREKKNEKISIEDDLVMCKLKGSNAVDSASIN